MRYMYHYHCFKLVNTITIIFSHPSVHLFPLPDLQLEIASPNPFHHMQRSPSPSSQSYPHFPWGRILCHSPQYGHTPPPSLPLPPPPPPPLNWPRNSTGSHYLLS